MMGVGGMGFDGGVNRDEKEKRKDELSSLTRTREQQQPTRHAVGMTDYGDNS